MGIVCTRRGHTTLAAFTSLLMTGVFALADETTPIKTLKNASVGTDGRGQPVSMQMQGSFFAGGNVITGATETRSTAMPLMSSFKYLTTPEICRW